MNWNNVVREVRPHVVKVETPSGYGTGYLCFYHGADRRFVGVATAHHVVANAETWLQPIRLHHQDETRPVTLRCEERRVLFDESKDTAVVLLSSDLATLLPEEPLPLLRGELPIGVEVGWMGYPGLVDDALCFFSGKISAFHRGLSAYLIDGVAINGVSGGPVFCVSSSGDIEIVGSIAAYAPNRATGEALPGLSVARDVSYLHKAVEARASVEGLGWARAESGSETPAAQGIEPTTSIGEMFRPRIPEFRALGWRVEVRTNAISLHVSLEDRQARRPPAVGLEFDPWVSDPAEPSELRPSSRPYRVRSRSFIQARPFEKFEPAVALFMFEAAMTAPSRK